MTAPAESPDFDELLEFLKRTRSFDFKAYKKPSLMRRIRRRMSVVGIENFEDYRRYLENEPEEFVHLFNTVLINVTAFFRDDAPWRYLQETILPTLLEQKHKAGPIRVWSAGCATGEEAFTLAMIFAETLGIDAFKNRVKIYATDIDEDALNIARHGTFSEKEIEGVPPDMLDKYFEPNNGRFIFRKELRRGIIFGRHDLLQDAPISRIDVLVCRNTLMYFNAPAQARILARMHFALADGGYLMLGRAETLLAHNATFRPVDLRLRVFTKTHSRAMLEPPFLMKADSDTPTWTGVLHDDVRDAAFSGTGVAHMVVDREGGLIMANDLARSLFQITARDLNRPFYELEVSYKPVELRSLIEQAYFEQRAIGVTGVEFKQRDQETWLETKVIPLTRRNGEVAGVSIVFTDVTQTKRLQGALERANFELQTSYEQLQSAHEEMETTNEELQSTVEELETTNEELQATNEELETMNEELQSTNEELQAVNDLARVYNGELDSANHFMESILSGLGHRVIVIDSLKNVILWNAGADEMWGVRADDAINQQLSSLEIGLPVDELDGRLQQILDGKKDRVDATVRATTRRGKPVDCEVSMVPLLSRDGSAVTGVIILTDNVTSDGVPEAIPRLRRV